MTPLSQMRFPTFGKRASSQLVAAEQGGSKASPTAGAGPQGVKHADSGAGGPTELPRTVRRAGAGTERGGGGQPEAATASGTEKRKPLCVISLYTVRSLCSLSGLGRVDPVESRLVSGGPGRTLANQAPPHASPAASAPPTRSRPRHSRLTGRQAPPGLAECTASGPLYVPSPCPGP